MALTGAQMRGIFIVTVLLLPGLGRFCRGSRCGGGGDEPFRLITAALPAAGRSLQRPFSKPRRGDPGLSAVHACGTPEHSSRARSARPRSPAGHGQWHFVRGGLWLAGGSGGKNELRVSRRASRAAITLLRNSGPERILTDAELASIDVCAVWPGSATVARDPKEAPTPIPLRSHLAQPTCSASHATRG